jgi:hypothetical protein
MLTVAFATENNRFDGEVYRVLLELLLGFPVTAWKSESRFSGWPSVLHLAKPYLLQAAERGVRHAVLSIDNDGGSKRHLEHEPDHDAQREALDPEGCRFCLLAEALPKSWIEAGNKRCLIVPVQTVETWLLLLRGDPLPEPPESEFNRNQLKRLFVRRDEHGRDRLKPPEEQRTAEALALLRREGAVTKLRERRSFRLFEEQLADWK